MRAYPLRYLWILVPALTLPVAGWVLGARGPEARVAAPANTVVEATYAVFKELGIPITGTDFEADEGEFDIEGERGDDDIEVSIERVGPRLTEIEVSVNEDLLDKLDDDDEDEAFARDILRRIVARVS